MRVSTSRSPFNPTWMASGGTRSTTKLLAMARTTGTSSFGGTSSWHAWQPMRQQSVAEECMRMKGVGQETRILTNNAEGTS